MLSFAGLTLVPEAIIVARATDDLPGEGHAPAVSAAAPVPGAAD
jgi:hypothetical protein